MINIIVPRRRMQRRRGLNPIQSYKHIVDLEDITPVVAGVQTFLTLADVVEARTGAVNQCIVGEHVYRMHVDLDILLDSSAIGGTFEIGLIKLRSGQSIPAVGSMGTSNLRNQMFYQMAGMLTPNDGGKVRLSRWIKIPKSFQRMREGDDILLLFVSNVAYDYKCQTIYKSYS